MRGGASGGFGGGGVVADEANELVGGGHAVGTLCIFIQSLVEQLLAGRDYWRL